MQTEIYLKIKENEHYLRYLRENSIWYKHLNRNPSFFKEFEKKVKEDYKLTSMDKISKTLDTITKVENIINSLR